MPNHSDSHHDNLKTAGMVLITTDKVYLRTNCNLKMQVGESQFNVCQFAMFHIST